MLLIDDHSTDKAIQSLNCSDSRLHTHACSGHGVVEAFNFGFSLATGSYIARMDADDISLKQRLTQQLDYLQQHPEVSIAGCCVEIFSENGIKGGYKRYQQWLNSVQTPADIHHQMFVESPMPNPGSLFRRSELEKLGGYRKMQWPEDYDLYLRADAAGMAMGKPEGVLLRWREHQRRITHSDGCYSREQFQRAKIHFLVKHRLENRAVIIWGAGPTGRLTHDLLEVEGAKTHGFIEVHPRRIGGQKRGLPVWSMDKIHDAGSALILVAVGTAGARSEIKAFMTRHNKQEGQDYLFVA